MLICISNIFHVRQTYPCFFDHTVERQVLLEENIGEERNILAYKTNYMLRTFNFFSLNL
jgi:hypothetical protein